MLSLLFHSRSNVLSQLIEAPTEVQSEGFFTVSVTGEEIVKWPISPKALLDVAKYTPHNTNRGSGPCFAPRASGGDSAILPRPGGEDSLPSGRSTQDVVPAPKGAKVLEAGSHRGGGKKPARDSKPTVGDREKQKGGSASPPPTTEGIGGGRGKKLGAGRMSDRQSGVYPGTVFQVVVGLVLTIALGISSWTVLQTIDLKERMASSESASKGARDLILDLKRDFNSQSMEVSSELREVRALLNEILLNGAKKDK